jgi:hypothetical protein
MHLRYHTMAAQILHNATRLQALFSPPRQHQLTNNCAFFSIFYMVVVVFPHVVTLVY